MDFEMKAKTNILNVSEQISVQTFYIYTLKLA